MSGEGCVDRHGAASATVESTRVFGASRNGAMGSGGAAREGGNVMEMQRRRLLLAIGEVVAEDGLEDASVGRICKRAGMSRRTFYEIFEDREACFLAAFQVAVERIARGVLDAYECGDRTRRTEGTRCAQDTRRARGTQRARGWRECIRAALTVLLERFDLEPTVAHLCLVESLKGSPPVLEYRRLVLDALSGAIDQARVDAKRGTGPATLTAESTVGGVLAVLHARVLVPDPRPLIGLLNPLMSMIVHPYLGAAAARRELEMPVPPSNGNVVERGVRNGAGPDPFRDLPIRFTYRTARVMSAIASQPGINNREVGDTAGVHDQGQMSKLLHRLQRNGLIDNHRSERARGEPNAWTLTERGRAVHAVIDTQTT